MDWSTGAVAIERSWSLETAADGPTKDDGPGRARAARAPARIPAGGRRPGPEARVVGFDPRKPFARAVEAAELADPQPTIHAMRHSTASWWQAAGMTEAEVAELLGHADATLMRRVYGHALPALRATAGERLEACLAGGGGA